MRERIWITSGGGSMRMAMMGDDGGRSTGNELEPMTMLMMMTRASWWSLNRE